MNLRFTSRTPYQKWVEGPWSVYDHASAQSFAKAVGEHDADFLTGRRFVETFAVLPVWRTQEQVIDEAFGPGAMVGGVHAEQRFEFIRTMQPGGEVRGRSRIVGVRQREKGTLLSVLSEVHDRAGLLGRQQQTLFALGVWLGPECEAASGEEIPAPGTGEVISPTYEGKWFTDTSQVSLYAKASGDFFRAHTDDAYARELGYPSVILHGMCTMGIATRSIRDCLKGYGDFRIASLGVRFSSAVVPPVELATRVNIVHATPTAVTGRFKTLDVERNVPVLSLGYFSAERP